MPDKQPKLVTTRRWRTYLFGTNGRIWWFEDSGNIFMSEVNDPLDYDYSPITPEDAQPDCIVGE